MGPYIVEIDSIVIREVQYQFEVNRCRNEEIIVKGNFEWAWPMWAGRPRVGNGAMHKVQYQFEVNRCRDEEIIVKGNFGCAGRPRINRIQFEVNWCRNEEIIAGCPRIDRIVIRKVQYQFEVNRCRNEKIIVKLQFWVGVAYVGGAPSFKEEIVVRTDRQTDRQTDGRRR
ncbi:hypothetical protein DPMN_017708 [Dreissena polymorpha]|uniref:Uncharacterized protein n=1 Tax=Dreissena polymorpha TaxID=45954 RepID=A0A9D4NFR7_DREPO|nr:hypothetical protein DPMN_017708 [Dreissena polymorpha]